MQDVRSILRPKFLLALSDRCCGFSASLTKTSSVLQIQVLPLLKEANRTSRLKGHEEPCEAQSVFQPSHAPIAHASGFPVNAVPAMSNPWTPHPHGRERRSRRAWWPPFGACRLARSTAVAGGSGRRRTTGTRSPTPWNGARASSMATPTGTRT